MRKNRTHSPDDSIGKFICLILRHKPELIGIQLDEHGWAEVDALLAGVSRTRPLDLAGLERIVAEDAKQRYSFNEDHTLIRCNQGHSVPVDVELPELPPPAYLYHGTAEKSFPSILAEGLRPMSRLYVHLSGDAETARITGKRHGRPVVLLVHSGRMAEAGFRFFRSVNGVWLTKAVPPAYLERAEAEAAPSD